MFSSVIFKLKINEVNELQIISNHRILIWIQLVYT